MKLLYLTTQTTGSDPEKHGLIRITGILEIDGKTVEEFDIKTSPFELDFVEIDFLEKYRLTVQQVDSYPLPDQACKKFSAILEQYVHPADSAKFNVITPQSLACCKFIEIWLRKNANKNFEDYVHKEIISVLSPLPTDERTLDHDRLELLLDILRGWNPLTEIRTYRDMIHNYLMRITHTLKQGYYLMPSNVGEKH